MTNNIVMINVRSVANAAAAREVVRHGRKLMIVPSATLPDNIVMNGIKYPADEIAASFNTLERTPAPAGHPKIGGKFVSARDPEGINIGYIGAWNENVRRHNGRVFLDKVIDVEVANRTDAGREVIAAIRQKKPIHTSTGLFSKLEPVPNATDHEFVAREIVFDHDAILLNEEGAATPDQGVGMMVNHAEDIKVINSSAEAAMQDLDWAAESAARAMERLEKAPLFARIKEAIVGAFAEAASPQIAEPRNGQKKENGMSDVTKSDFDGLVKQVGNIDAKVDKALSGLGDTVKNAVDAALKPVTDTVAEIKANQQATEDAEKAELVAKVVKANILDEESAKDLTINALRKLAEKAKPGKAAALAGGGGGNKSDDDEWAGYSLNSVIDGKKEEAA